MKTELRTPVGRMIMGDLYNPQTVDLDGKPIIIKSGPNINQPGKKWFFALAIKKGAEQHWAQTIWGKLIYDTAVKDFPNKQYEFSNFAWKVADGDSTLLNQKGNKLCDREGAPGHWILNFSTPPVLLNAANFIETCNHNGSEYFNEPGLITPGDYIQVFAYVSGNGEISGKRNPGMYLTAKIVALRATGEKIFVGVDAKNVGFGDDPMPQDARLITNTEVLTTAQIAPHSQSIAPVTALGAIPVTTIPQHQNVITNTPPLPYPQILNPQVPIAPAIPTPPPPAKKMTEKAGTISYDQFKANGWKDEQLIQDGYMLP